MTKDKKQNLSGEIALSIRNKIYSGELKAGTHLIEQEIAREYGVSRGPVREALKELEHGGLIVSEANRGSKIAYLTGEDAYEIFYLRGSLERMALERCGSKLSESSILSMKDILEKMRYEEEHENRLQLKIEYDERFHEEIVKASRMKRLYQLWKNLSPLNGSMFLKVEDYHKCHEEAASHISQEIQKKPRKKLWQGHQEMLEAIESGDLQRAIQVTEAHYYDSGTKILRWEIQKENS